MISLAAVLCSLALASTPPRTDSTNITSNDQLGRVEIEHHKFKKWKRTHKRGSTTRSKARLALPEPKYGSAASHHGFHIIVSTQNKSWHEKSHALAIEARTALEAAGFARSTYIGSGTALSLRDDIGTLNLSNMPSIMAELGNMRNAHDAAVTISADGQHRYATALVAAARTYLESR